MQRFELTFKIPPAGGDGFKFSDLFVVYVMVFRRFFGIHWHFYSVIGKTNEYIRHWM
ncbi:Uncharacterised protein [Shigella sonnei]|nr:Uncharacterised protein [Shigella sonnei]